MKYTKYQVIIARILLITFCLTGCGRGVNFYKNMKNQQNSIKSNSNLALLAKNKSKQSLSKRIAIEKSPSLLLNEYKEPKSFINPQPLQDINYKIHLIRQNEIDRIPKALIIHNLPKGFHKEEIIEIKYNTIQELEKFQYYLEKNIKIYPYQILKISKNKKILKINISLKGGFWPFTQIARAICAIVATIIAAVVYIAGKIVHGIYKLFAGDSPEVRRLKEKINSLHFEIQKLGINKLKNKIRDKKRLRRQKEDQIRTEEEAIETAENNINDYINLINQIDENAYQLNQDKEKYQLESELNNLRNILRNEYDQIRQQLYTYAQEKEIAYNDIIVNALLEQTSNEQQIDNNNEINQNIVEYKKILNCQLQANHDFTVNINFLYEQNQESLPNPPLIQQLETQFEQDFRNQFDPLENQLISEHLNQLEILKLLIKIKEEQEKITQSNNKIHQLEIEINQLTTEIEELENELLELENKKRELEKEIEKYKALLKKAEKNSEFPSFSELQNGIYQGLNKVVEAIGEAILEAAVAITKAVIYIAKNIVKIAAYVAIAAVIAAGIVGGIVASAIIILKIGAVLALYPLIAKTISVSLKIASNVCLFIGELLGENDPFFKKLGGVLHSGSEFVSNYTNPFKLTASGIDFLCKTFNIQNNFTDSLVSGLKTIGDITTGNVVSALKNGFNTVKNFTKEFKDKTITKLCNWGHSFVSFFSPSSTYYIKETSNMVLDTVSLFSKEGKRILLLDSSDKNLIATNFRIRSIWLLHGVVAAPISIASGLFTDNSCTHWWIEIFTKGN